MKLFDSLKLYPHGFLGLPMDYASPSIRKSYQVNVVGNIAHSLVVEPENDTLKPSVVIDGIYKKTISDPDIWRSFEIREELLKEALRIFGTPNIDDWVYRQKHNPYFGTMHNRFVDETIEYVLTGRRRNHVSIYLTSLKIDRQNAFRETDNMRQVRYAYDGRKLEPTPVVDFVGRWLEQPDSLNDMIQSLWIMFGSD